MQANMYVTSPIYVLAYWYMQSDERMDNYMMQCSRSRAAETSYVYIVIGYSYVYAYIVVLNMCTASVQSIKKI